MVKYEPSDFLELDFDIYANGVLINTTSPKLIKEKNLKHLVPKPQTIILGKDMILKKLDDEILKGENSKTLELKPEDAFGKFDNKLIATYSENTFKEQKLRAVVGMAYNFDGRVGVVKSVQRGRILVDFNHLLAGKNIKIEYNVLKKVEDLKSKIIFVLENILKVPKNSFEVKEEKSKLNLNFASELNKIKDFILSSLKQNIIDLDDSKLNFEFTIKSKPKNQNQN